MEKFPARFEPRDADGWGLGMTLAVGVHLMLVAALALGVSWKIQTPDVVEAEVWDRVPTAASPPPAPAPEAPPQTEPEPQAQQPVPLTPQAKPEPEPERTPDIVVQRKKEPPKEPKRKERREPEEEKPKPVKKVELKPEPKPEPKAKDKPKPTPEPKVDPKAEAKAKAAEAKARADAEAKANADRESQRKANLARMMGELGNGSQGASSRSAGPSASYAGRIRARVKPNIVFTANVSGNPKALVEVRCGPDGRILSRKLIESSGNEAWDESVLRAVDRTEVLPADENGRVPPVLQMEFRPHDF